MANSTGAASGSRNNHVPTDNPANNSYYLHPNDSPTIVLVQPPVNPHNFHSWSRTFQMALLAKNKTCFIDGSVSKHADNYPQLQAWRQVNTMTQS